MVMKRYLLMSLLGIMILAGEVHAQLQKGADYLGGTVKFNGEVNRNEDKSDADNASNTGSHYVTPELQMGEFIGEHTMIGVGVKYSYGVNRYDFGTAGLKTVGSSNLVAVLPFIRQYKSLGRNWSVFLHGEIGPQFHWNKTKETNETQTRILKVDFWQYGLSIKPGVVYVFPKTGWAVEGYANVLSLNANYLPLKEKVGGYFTFDTGISTGFPSFFTIRVAKYFSSKNE
jgi:hypothetical protein